MPPAPQPRALSAHSLVAPGEGARPPLLSWSACALACEASASKLKRRRPRVPLGLACGGSCYSADAPILCRVEGARRLGTLGECSAGQASFWQVGHLFPCDLPITLFMEMLETRYPAERLLATPGDAQMFPNDSLLRQPRFGPNSANSGRAGSLKLTPMSFPKLRADSPQTHLEYLQEVSTGRSVASSRPVGRCWGNRCQLLGAVSGFWSETQ